MIGYSREGRYHVFERDVFDPKKGTAKRKCWARERHYKELTYWQSGYKERTEDVRNFDEALREVAVRLRVPVQDVRALVPKD